MPPAFSSALSPKERAPPSGGVVGSLYLNIQLISSSPASENLKRVHLGIVSVAVQVSILVPGGEASGFPHPGLWGFRVYGCACRGRCGSSPAIFTPKSFKEKFV